MELADKTHDLKDAQEEIKRTTTDFGDRLSNIRGTITGVAGGFQAMIGTLSLLGVNLGDDVKMLKLLQSAMAITQGVAAIDAGVKSFKALSISIKAASVAAGGFKKALLATGVGALVIGVGLLIANLDKLTRLFSGYADESKKFAQANEQLKASIDALNESTDFEVELMKQDGATAVEIAKKRRDVANAALEEAKANYDMIASKKELHGEELAQLREAQKIEDEMRDRAWKAEQAVWLAERQARIDQNKDAEEAAKKRLEAQREAAQKAEEEKKREMANIAKIEREAEIGLMGDREGELAKLEDTYKEQLALYEKRGQDTTKLTEYYRQQVKEINDKYYLEDEEREIEMWERRSAAAVAGIEKLIAAEQDAYTRMQIDTDNRLAADYSEEKVQEAEEMMERAYLALLDKKIELQKQLLENENLTAEDYIAVQDNLLALQQERAEKSVAIEQKALEKRKKLNENYESEGYEGRGLLSTQVVSGIMYTFVASHWVMREDNSFDAWYAVIKVWQHPDGSCTVQDERRITFDEAAELLGFSPLFPEAGSEPGVIMNEFFELFWVVNWKGLYVRVAETVEINGQTGLYVSQGIVEENGSVMIPLKDEPGVKITGISVALVPTIEDISSPTPNVVDAKAMLFEDYNDDSSWLDRLPSWLKNLDLSRIIDWLRSVMQENRGQVDPAVIEDALEEVPGLGYWIIKHS